MNDNDKQKFLSAMFYAETSHCKCEGCESLRQINDMS